MVLPDALDVVEGSLLGSEDGRHTVIPIFLGHFVILVRGVDLLVENVLEVGLE